MGGGEGGKGEDKRGMSFGLILVKSNPKSISKENRFRELCCQHVGLDGIHIDTACSCSTHYSCFPT